MYATALIAVLASTAFAAPIAQRAAPSGWAHGYLEDYETYHSRYVALSCQTQHNTTFFEDCCHPLLATETLADNREAYCTPNATQSASAASYNQTATATASADIEAESEYCSASEEASATSTTVAATSAVVDSQGSWAKGKSSSSEAAAEATSTTSKWVAPSTTSTTQEAAQTSAASSSGSLSGDVKTGGYATYFYQGGNAGACGTVHSDSDKVIAIDSNGWWSDYASNSNSPYCGKWITIKNVNNGKTVTAQVADVCPTCVSDNSLDLSVGAFTAIASESEGSVAIEWTWA